MKRRSVVFTNEAQDDLFHMYEWIAEAGEAERALTFIARVEQFCLGFDLASERGQRRDDIRPGLRIVGFEKTLTIAFAVDDNRVVILRLFYRGRDWSSQLNPDPI